MKINILAITPLILTVLLTTASIGATKDKASSITGPSPKKLHTGSLGAADEAPLEANDNAKELGDFNDVNQNKVCKMDDQELLKEVRRFFCSEAGQIALNWLGVELSQALFGKAYGSETNTNTASEDKTLIGRIAADEIMNFFAEPEDSEEAAEQDKVHTMSVQELYDDIMYFLSENAGK
ncbi:hypothetical protein IWQ61_010720, partial [Dispira simplex]